jgi:S-DNA-T family DNA segregation ATPase FtsK/SpoIIIE
MKSLWSAYQSLQNRFARGQLGNGLAAIDVRVEAPIPGKSAIGIEVPNEHRRTVTLRDVIENPEFKKRAVQVDVRAWHGCYRHVPLRRPCKMPHLLIGGSTGSGKSVCINTLICSLLYRATPRELKFLMIDPKRSNCRSTTVFRT